MENAGKVLRSFQAPVVKKDLAAASTCLKLRNLVAHRSLDKQALQSVIRKTVGARSARQLSGRCEQSMR